MRKAFTMIELIMVIVILGILSSVAISKMAMTRDDAILTKGRSQVASIRSAISLLKSKNMMTGNGLYPPFLDDEHIASDKKLFDGNNSIGKLLDYPIYAKDENGNWRKTAQNSYVFKALNTDINFTYNPNDGSFDCDHTSSDANIKKYCKALAE